MGFPQAISAQLAGQVVRRATLVEFDFVTEPVRVWDGSRKLITNDDREWKGAYGLGTIEGVQQAINGAAPELVFTTSGVDATFMQKAKAEAGEYVNRAVRIFAQFFDEDWNPLDLPFALSWGIMRSLTTRRQYGEQGFVRTVQLRAETPFGNTKRRPRFAYCTDRDQQLRYPGDTGMSRVAGIEVKQVKFPDY